MAGIATPTSTRKSSKSSTVPLTKCGRTLLAVPHKSAQHHAGQNGTVGPIAGMQTDILWASTSKGAHAPCEGVRLPHYWPSKEQMGPQKGQWRRPPWTKSDTMVVRFVKIRQFMEQYGKPTSSSNLSPHRLSDTEDDRNISIEFEVSLC